MSIFPSKLAEAGVNGVGGGWPVASQSSETLNPEQRLYPNANDTGVRADSTFARV